MPNHNIRILVSGASVAGLSSAYWLARHGFTVTVVERAPHLRLGGQALDIRGPALAVVEKMGVHKRLKECTTKLTGMSMVDEHGTGLYRSTERTLTGGKLDSPDLEVMRDTLCQIMFDALDQSVEFIFGETIVSIAQDQQGVDVAFARAKPRRFDLVVGADGQYSGVRRLVFGPDERFLRFMKAHIAVFSIPNFLGLDRWEIFCRAEMSALMLAPDKNAKARVYLGFETDEPIHYDHRDIVEQKQLIAARYANAGWEYPTILSHMLDADDFYFYSANQVRLDHWSRGRVVLVGDAGYSVTPATGQGTTVALVGAYVLAGELSSNRDTLEDGIRAYETELRDYVDRNLDLAIDMSAASSDSDDIPDFGAVVQHYNVKDYDGEIGLKDRVAVDKYPTGSKPP